MSSLRELAQSEPQESRFAIELHPRAVDLIREIDGFLEGALSQEHRKSLEWAGARLNEMYGSPDHPITTHHVRHWVRRRRLPQWKRIQQLRGRGERRHHQKSE